MCGIFGYIGKQQNAPDFALSALRQLEYRGYDSWGLACQKDKGILVLKQTGRIPVEVPTPESSLVIGHTRWATHGGVTQENAHPHVVGPIAIVHNGIIENYKELKEHYQFTHVSETDTEILAALIAYHFEETNDLVKAVRNALHEVRGTFGIVVMHQETQQLVVARRGSPLLIGIRDKEFFVASDVAPLLAHTKQVVYLEDEQLAVLDTQLTLQELATGKKITPRIEEITWSVEAAQKQGFEHFMLKEIFEQPQAIIETLQGRIEKLPEELNSLHLERVERILILGCGTSWHAGLVGEFILEELARIPVEVEYASEFRYRNPLVMKNTLCIAVSQSGETADTLAALREAKTKGAQILALCNVQGSTIARESDAVLLTRAGPEIGVASTKAFTTQVTAFFLITTHLSRIRKTLPEQKVQELFSDLAQVPSVLKQLLAQQETYRAVANKIKDASNALFLGRGVLFPIALEGALKLKEVSYIHAEGYPAAEMKHGPIALIDEKLPVIVLATKDSSTYEKVLGNIQEVKARKGYVIAIATEGDTQITELADEVLFVPKTRYSFSALTTSIPLQLISYYVALERSCDIDKPRNLAKSVTVE